MNCMVCLYVMVLQSFPTSSPSIGWYKMEMRETWMIVNESIQCALICEQIETLTFSKKEGL